MNLKPYQIKPTDHIELWKYFSQRADELKDRRWTIVTWMLGICIGLTAFILKASGVIENGISGLEQSLDYCLDYLFGLITYLFINYLVYLWEAYQT